MNIIPGVVGSMGVEHVNDMVRIKITFANSDVRYVETDPQRVKHLWLPALSADENDPRKLETEGSGIKITKKDGLTYVEPTSSIANRQDLQAIFTKSQVDRLIKVLL